MSAGEGSGGDGIWPLVGAAAMRALDRHSIETLGVPGEVLMESAGRAVVEAVLREVGPGAPVTVVCGTGNNGGDGLVVARHLSLLGTPVRVVLVGDPGRLGADAARQLARARRLGLEPERWRAPTGGAIVDALFGTGLQREVEGEAKSAIRRINAAREARLAALRVVAVDLPSGLCADTGQVLGEAVDADCTVTFQLPKPGLALEPGRSRAGEVRVARIGIAPEAPDVTPDAWLWTRRAAAARLPPRGPDGHKGSFGHVLLAAGSEGKSGAAVLAAEGALRAGAGLVTVACPAGLHDVLETRLTEAMTAPLPDTERRGLAGQAEEGLLALAETREVLGLGPGLGREDETGALVRAVAKRLSRPLALDADALFAFGAEPGALAARRAPTVLTPHPGEAARLLGSRAADLNRDRLGAARRLAERAGSVVLLKGAASVVAEPGGRVVVNPTGGPVLGTGGTGDVLLGVLCAYLAAGVPAFEAAALAAFVHGWAGDRLAARVGDRGVTAGDLAAELPTAVAGLRAAPAPRGGSLELRFPEP